MVPAEALPSPEGEDAEAEEVDVEVVLRVKTAVDPVMLMDLVPRLRLRRVDPAPVDGAAEVAAVRAERAQRRTTSPSSPWSPPPAHPRLRPPVPLTRLPPTLPFPTPLRRSRGLS
jgi:hypothetical protein